MWRVCCLALWVLEHDKSNTLLSPCAHALVALVLLSGLTEPDELATALSCSFVLDIRTIMQHEASIAEQESWQNDFEQEPSEAARLLDQYRLFIGGFE